MQWVEATTRSGERGRGEEKEVEEEVEEEGEEE